MAFAELTSTMAQVPLTYGCTLVFEAIDPTTGNPVPDVTITNPVIYGHDLMPSPGAEQTLTTTVEPLYLPVATDLPPQDGEAA